VFPLRLPPLRARLVDLPLLAEGIVAQLTVEANYAPSLSPGALETLAAYAWPGNIRELRNVLERALILSQGRSLCSDDVHRALNLRADQIRSAAHGVTFGDDLDDSLDDATLADLERDIILQRLARLEGNRTHAARSLGISLRTLRNKIRDYRSAGFAVPEPARALP